MTEDLYFIPVLDKAFRQTKPWVALKDAFDEIKRLGKQEQYREGFVNFVRFMGQICKYQELRKSDSMRQLIAEIATETFDGTEKEKQAVIKVIMSRAEFKAECETICKEAGVDQDKYTDVVIQVFCQKRLIGEKAFTKIPDRKSIEGILPGSYMFRLNIGRVIWQGNLTGKDLIWIEAFGAKRLDLAAETENNKRIPTRKIVLLGGDVVLRTFAGVESGSIEVELTK